MRVEEGKKRPKKRWIISHFYDVPWLIFETLCPATLTGFIKAKDLYSDTEIPMHASECNIIMLMLKIKCLK